MSPLQYFFTILASQFAVNLVKYNLPLTFKNSSRACVRVLVHVETRDYYWAVSIDFFSTICFEAEPFTESSACSLFQIALAIELLGSACLHAPGLGLQMLSSLHFYVSARSPQSVLRLVQQASYPLSHLPSPLLILHSNCLDFINPDIQVSSL